MTGSRENDGIWLVLQETIAMHHEEVYDCFTTGGGLMRWYPVDAEIDLQTGGSIIFYWNREKSRKLTVAILEYDPGGKITWDWYAGSEGMHAPLYWEVKPNVEKGSVVTLRQGPFREDADSLMIMAEEAASWSWYLCNLRSSLETKFDMRKVKPL